MVDRYMYLGKVLLFLNQSIFTILAIFPKNALELLKYNAQCKNVKKLTKFK